MWRQSEAAADAQLDALCRLLDGGSIQLYAGAQPATLDAARARLLAEIPLADPAFSRSSGGRAEVLAVPTPAFALSAGEPGWFVVADRGGVPQVSGRVGAELDIDRSTIEKGAHLIVSGFALRAEHV